MSLSCTQCHATLPSEDATATHCRHCRAPLPHGDAAAQHQAMMRNFMANPGGQPPSPMPAQYGQQAQYAPQQAQAGFMPAYGVAQPAIVFGGYSNLGASITKSVDQSMKMGLWITIATVGGTILVTAMMLLFFAFR